MAIPQEILLINEELLKKYTPITDAVDPNLIRPCIYVAQDMYLQNFLGTNLTIKLKDDVANGTLADQYEILLNEYVIKLLIWWTLVELYPSLLYKHDNGNLVSRQSEDTTPVTKGEMESLKEKARENARFYTKRLVDYLRFNSSLYPEYTNNTNDNIFPDRNPYGKSNFLISDSYKNQRQRWSIQNFLPPTY
jgi:hypothetical protein